MFIGGILVACTLLNLGWGTGYSSSDDEVVDGLVDNFARGVTCQQFEHWCEVNTCIYDVRWKVCHMILWRSRGFSSYPPHFFRTILPTTQASAKEVFLQAERTERLLKKHGPLNDQLACLLFYFFLVVIFLKATILETHIDTPKPRSLWPEGCWIWKLP